MGDLWEEASFSLGKGSEETGVPDGEKDINQDIGWGNLGGLQGPMFCGAQDDGPGKPDTAMQRGFEKLCEGFGFHCVEDTEGKDMVRALESAMNVKEGDKRSPEAEES